MTRGRNTEATPTRRVPRDRYVVRLSGALNRHEVEALQIEIRSLAKRHRLAIADISVRPATARASG